MFNERGLKVSSRLVFLFLLDAFCIIGSILMSSFIRLGIEPGREYFFSNIRSIIGSGLIFIVVFFITGLYERQVLAHRKGSLAGIMIATAISLALVIVSFYARAEYNLGRGILLLAGVFIILTTWVSRRVYKLGVGYGMFKKNALIVGDFDEASRVVRIIGSTPDAGIKLFGVVSNERPAPGQFIEGLPLLGHVDMLREFTQVYDIETVIVATSLNREPALLRILRPLRYSGVEILDYAGLCEQLVQEIPIDHIDDEWLMHAAMNSSRIHIRKMKRVMDVVSGLVGLVLSAPIAMIVSVLIKMDSPGPVLYRQIRSGLDGRAYTLYKFRTMKVDAESGSGAVWAGKTDNRVTRVGKFLRKSRIDEIPQLWNVLTGTMSLVGPRPERPEFIDSLAEAIPFYRERLLVHPGITGWAQVVSPYAASIESSRKKLQYDLYYIKHMSFFLDCLIVLRTVKTILVGLRHSEDFDRVEAEEREHEKDIIRVLPKGDKDITKSA